MNDTDFTSPLHILLVEDNHGDALLMREAITTDQPRHVLHHVRDGEEALRFLSRTGEHRNAVRPDLILLDLNLPLLDGRQLLARLKRSSAWCDIAVVVLSASSSQTDVLASYKLHATGYVTKPADLDEFSNVARSIDDLWRSISSNRLGGQPEPMPSWASWPWGN